MLRLFWGGLSIVPGLASGAVVVTGQQSIESHGYLRTGIGVSERGHSQARFQAPGARGKYRLVTSLTQTLNCSLITLTK